MDSVDKENLVSLVSPKGSRTVSKIEPLFIEPFYESQTRSVQVMKERVRAHTNHLPFTLNITGVVMCILYCVSRLICEPSETRAWGVCPREAFLGRQLDGRRDFRCAFGDYVLATVPTTDNSMDARAEEHVVMLPIGNRTGSVKMISPTTGRLVSRDQFRVLTMPASVIAAINELARKDGRTVRTAGIGTYPAANNIAPDHRSDLPDYITIIPHNGDQPDIEPQQHGAIAPMGEGNLADEAKIDHHPPNEPQEYDAGGGGR
jgi:hypothetical protein